jgi:hypothetical protein
MTYIRINEEIEILNSGFKEAVVELCIFQRENGVGTSMIFQNRNLTDGCEISMVERRRFQAAPRAKS